MFLLPIAAHSQSPARPGFPVSRAPAPVDSVKYFSDSISTLIAYPVYAAVAVWNYIIDHTAAATLLTATVAGFIAINSIRTTRSVARLRETFTTYSNDNWDEDVIKARKLFSEIKKTCANKPQEIASYVEQLPEHDTSSAGNPQESSAKAAAYEQMKEEHAEVVVTLRTLMNDYENKALGIRAGILDEDYAYRYSRGSVLTDWQALAPLATAYRFKFKNDLIFIEFEGLCNAWTQGRSFRTGKKLKLSKKRTVFR